MCQKSQSLSQLEADVSVHCLMASACRKDVFRGQDAVSRTRMQVLFQRYLRYNAACLLFKGVMFSLGSGLSPETWIEFCTGQPGSWQNSPTWKPADCHTLKGDL